MVAFGVQGPSGFELAGILGHFLQWEQHGQRFLPGPSKINFQWVKALAMVTFCGAVLPAGFEFFLGHSLSIGAAWSQFLKQLANGLMSAF